MRFMKGKQIKLKCICLWQSLIVLRCVVDKALKSSYCPEVCC